MGGITRPKQNTFFANWVIFPVCFCISAFFSAVVYSITGWSGFSFIFFVIGLAVLWGYLSTKHYEIESSEIMQIRHNKAMEIYEALANESAEIEFCIYLRSFKTEKMACAWYFDEDEITTPDDELAYAFEKVKVPLIGLGERRSSIVGAGRIETADEEWQKAIALLYRKARFIIILPGGTEGIRTEIGQISKVDILKNKTIFIMPPFPFICAPRIRWLALQEELKDVIGCFPDFNERGLIFNYSGHSKEIKGHVENPHSLAVLILDLVESRNKTTMQ